MLSGKRRVGVATSTLALVAGSFGIQATAPDPAHAEGSRVVTIMAYPNDQLMRQTAIGESMTMSLVQGTVTTKADGTYEVAPVRDSVPARSVTTTGVVNFYVQVLEEDGTITEGAFPLLQDPTDSRSWIDPALAAQAQQVRRQLARGVERSGALHRLRSAGFTSTAIPLFNHSAASSDPDGLEGTWTALVDERGDGSASSVPTRRGGSGAADCDLYAQDPVSTTVATSYPTQGDKSWLTYSSSEHTTTGVATTVGSGGSFHASGTKTTGDEWGQDFAKSDRNRSYRVEINYGLYECTNVITGYRWYQTAPRFQTGGTGQNILDRSDRPDWNDPDYCRDVANGDWWRGSTRGSDYYLSYGVKIASAIGIDLSSKHVYSTGTRLYYGVTGGNKRLCGSNNVPAKAMKLIERLR